MMHWSDARVPADDVCVLGALLELRALEMPDRAFASFEDGAVWTYSQALEIVRSTALGLKNLGVQSGDYVNVWMPNGPDAVRIWFALNWLGAVYVPINLAYRGRILEHVLANTGSRLIVIHAELIERLMQIDSGQLSEAVVMGGAPESTSHLRMHDAAVLSPRNGIPPARAPVHPWDPQMVIYTSGTTGPSKGVLVSYFHLYSAISGSYPHLGPDDRFLINLPMFHLAGAGLVMSPFYFGGTFAMVSSFKTSEFWSVVRETQSTSAILLGPMVPFLLRQPERADDRNHSLRSAMIVPLSAEASEFSRRFGTDVYTAYSMTETSTPLRAGPNRLEPGSCGTPRPGVQVRIVDEHDCEAPRGTVGELLVRTDAPWAMNSGYLKDPSATAHAWRNGWFHTGDAFRQDEQGNFFFVDRIKDAIRRRGENISSFEVEREVCTHPAIREAAAVAVPSELGEDEVLVVAVLEPNLVLDPADLIHYLLARMPHFMAPRYVRFVTDLPKTPTHKVMKHVLRSDGVTSDTFDREAAGIRVVAERVAANCVDGQESLER